MFRACSPPTADGARTGQHDSAVLLDLLARQHAAGCVDGFEDHHAFAIEPADFGRAWDALVRDGLAEARGGLLMTAAGLTHHAEVELAKAVLAAAVDAHPARAA